MYKTAEVTKFCKANSGRKYVRVVCTGCMPEEEINEH